MGGRFFFGQANAARTKSRPRSIWASDRGQHHPPSLLSRHPSSTLHHRMSKITVETALTLYLLQLNDVHARFPPVLHLLAPLALAATP